MIVEVSSWTCKQGKMDKIRRKNSQPKAENAMILCIGFHISLSEPPTTEKGGPPKKPAKNRQVNCAPRLCDKPAPVMKSMKNASDTMYTGFRPTVSEIGPATKAPNPIPARN